MRAPALRKAVTMPEPLLLALDEIGNLAPLPSLPTVALPKIRYVRPASSGAE